MDQRVGTSSCVMHASKLLFREDDQLVFLEQSLEAIYIFKSLSVPGKSVTLLFVELIGQR